MTVCTDASVMTESTSAADSAMTEVVQQMGTWFSMVGAPRAAGQVFGYMLVCDPAEQAAGEISRGTGLSAASVSSSARLLLGMSALEQRHRVGDRKTYYRLRSSFWIAMAKAKFEGFGQLAEMGRETKASGGLTRTDGLDEMIAFADFWQEELPQLAERWERFRSSRKEDA